MNIYHRFLFGQYICHEYTGQACISKQLYILQVAAFGKIKPTPCNKISTQTKYCGY